MGKTAPIAYHIGRTHGYPTPADSTLVISGSAPPRILIVKLTAIGDVIHAMPTAVALRERFPDAFIAWVVEGHAGDLLAGHRAIDELLVVRRRWLKSPRCVLDLRRQLRSLKFDVTLDLQGLSKSAIAASLSGAPRRIGFGGSMGREISRWLNNERVLSEKPHVVDRSLELLRPLGIETPEVRFDVPRFPEDAASIGRWLLQQHVGERFALINPGAGWPSKVWPAGRFAEVARHLVEQRELPVVVVWAGETERQWAEQITRECGRGALLAPSTTLTELAELTRRASLLVASDTGPLHLGAAIGTPCVGLFGPMPTSRNGPYGSGHIALQNATLTGTSRERRTANNVTMLAISVEEVSSACDEVLERGDGAGTRQRVA